MLTDPKLPDTAMYNFSEQHQELPVPKKILSLQNTNDTLVWKTVKTRKLPFQNVNNKIVT